MGMRMMIWLSCLQWCGLRWWNGDVGDDAGTSNHDGGCDSFSGNTLPWIHAFAIFQLSNIVIWPVPLLVIGKPGGLPRHRNVPMGWQHLIQFFKFPQGSILSHRRKPGYGVSPVAAAAGRRLLIFFRLWGSMVRIFHALLVKSYDTWIID